MPFFLILPLWLLIVILGVVMLCIRLMRRLGVYILMMSTLAVIASFALSTAVLLVVPWATPNPVPGWFAVLFLLAYLAAIGVGGLIGAIGGFLLTYWVLKRKQSAPRVGLNHASPRSD